MGEYANDYMRQEMKDMGFDPGPDFDYQEDLRTYKGGSLKKRTHCPHCKKQITVVGLPDHIKAKHTTPSKE